MRIPPRRYHVRHITLGTTGAGISLGIFEQETGYSSISSLYTRCNGELAADVRVSCVHDFRNISSIVPGLCTSRLAQEAPRLDQLDKLPRSVYVFQ